MNVITGLDVRDVRFPTSRMLAGSDAMNPAPDYSAAYLTLRTSEGTDGHALVFTIGEGTDLQVAAVRMFEPLVAGLPVADVVGDLGAFSRRLIAHSPFRWLGPEKGVVHMAIGGIVNAAWDMFARREGKPLWKALADLAPADVVDLVDFRYLEDALTRDEALDILTAARDGREEREAALLADGYPAYTTGPGWLGYDDGALARLAGEAIEAGFSQIKLKVGGELERDQHRLGLTREVVGPDVRIAVDANQVWDVPGAIAWMQGLAGFDPYWIEEPTSPDDVLGHARIRAAIAPIRVATGEHAHSRVMFKQFLQAQAIDVINLDACRVAGVTENIAILLLGAKFGVPVCPHAGGVGLCEMVQHLAMFDYLAVSGSQQGRMLEYVDHLHEHFAHPVEIRDGRYVAPRQPGNGAQMLAASLDEYEFGASTVAMSDEEAVP
jgi:L-fuconate dehydratase